MERLGLKPLARIVGYAQAEVAPKWLFLAPVEGVRRLLDRIDLPIDAFDLIEINEAFAAQTLADGRELGFDWEKVNVNGGAIALGHPIGASGARIVATLLHELGRREGRYGLATLCLGGGGSVAMAVERCLKPSASIRALALVGLPARRERQLWRGLVAEVGDEPDDRARDRWGPGASRTSPPTFSAGGTARSPVSRRPLTVSCPRAALAERSPR